MSNSRYRYHVKPSHELLLVFYLFLRNYLYDLRRSMAPKSGTDQFFRKGRPLYPRTGGGGGGGRQLQRKRRGSEVQPLSAKRQRQTFSEEGQSQQETVTIEFVTVNVFISLPLVHVLPEMHIPLPLSTS